jgi:transcriptional regulator of heat shock response
MDFRYYDIPDDRSLIILESVVRLYTDAAAPVSSTAVARDLGHRWSSATIRKVFMELEDAGWLVQPHTSSGRVPTDLGFRTYVERIVRPGAKQARLSPWLESELDLRNASLTELLGQASGLLSRISHALGLTLLVVSPAEAEEENRIRITGVDQLLDQPEFEDPQRLKVLVHMLDDATPIRSYLRDLGGNPGEINVRIGEENTLSELSRFALVTTRIDRSRETALMGLLGPVRLEYAPIMDALESLIRLLHSGTDASYWS